MHNLKTFTSVPDKCVQNTLLQATYGICKNLKKDHYARNSAARYFDVAYKNDVFNQRQDNLK